MSAVYWYRFQVPLLADVQRKGTVPPKKKGNPEAVEKPKPQGRRENGDPRSAPLADLPL